MEKLTWLPLYIDDLLSSPAWLDMKDYERGWFLQLLLRCTRSERLGYLKVDGNLWKIAGAHSLPMWENHNRRVMACFKIRHDDGTQWLYNVRLLAVMEDQSQKYLRRSGGAVSPSTSPDEFRSNSKKTGEEVSLTTPNLPPSALARALLEKIGLPVSMGNMRIVSAAIEAVGLASGIVASEAFDWLLERVQIAASRGDRIDKFYFEDGRYNHDESKQPKSSQDKRKQRNRATLTDAFCGVGAEDAGHGSGENGEGTDADRSGIVERTARGRGASGD
jgi:hypothetical protein